MGKVILILFLAFLGAVQCSESKQETDNQAESSVTSYSTVVIHHPPKGKKANLVRDGEEGRSQAYFKVKRVKASTVAPLTSNIQNGHNGGDFRVQNNEFRLQNDVFNAQNSDFRPSQYLPEPEIRVSYRGNKDQSVQAARQTEYRQSKDQRDPELRKSKYGGETHGERESVSWNQHYQQGPKYHDSKKEQLKQNHQETQHHREIYRESFPPRNEGQGTQSAQQNHNFQSFTYDTQNAIPSFPVEIRNPYEQFAGLPEQTHRPAPPPGMSKELIETLLSQQPQTFDTEKKVEPKKKSKSQTFKVGYSIGFGGGDDVVLGRPKDVRLQVNGRNSVWKTLPNGVEMSQEVDNKKQSNLKLHDTSVKASDNVLKNDVYYMNNYKPDTSVPTSGRTSFDHAQALTHSNSFDFSNAVDPQWLKQPRTIDMGSIYQSLGYPAPLPVLIPGGGPRGEGTMVQAIVIPIESIAGLDYTSNWAGLSQVPMVPVATQPVAQALTLNPVVTAAPVISQTQAPKYHSSSMQHSSSSISSHGHEKSRFKARAPKAKDSLKQGSYNSAPIVVAPAPSSRQASLQEELNNILAEEMKRKNNRVPAVGLRPPPPF